MNILSLFFSGNPPETSVPGGDPSIQITGTKWITNEQWSGRPTVIEKPNGEIVMFFVTGNSHADNTGQLINIKF